MERKITENEMRQTYRCENGTVKMGEGRAGGGVEEIRWSVNKKTDFQIKPTQRLHKAMYMHYQMQQKDSPAHELVRSSELALKAVLNLKRHCAFIEQCLLVVSAIINIFRDSGSGTGANEIYFNVLLSTESSFCDLVQLFACLSYDISVDSYRPTVFDIDIKHTGM